jgi:ppGpp synthetase/RelA/SpoT-type nucleotidyltranferase
LDNDALLNTLRKEYQQLLLAAEHLERELSRQLQHLFDSESVALALPLQTRVKDWSSIQDKLQRVPLSLKAIDDLQDLVGLRVVTLFSRDAVRVCELIASNLTVVRRYDTKERLRGDQCGYASIHFVVRAPEEWIAAPTMRALDGRQAEIQVRTLAQHLWAAASHELQYKREESVPEALRRSVHRASALLETVDLEFERILAERDAYLSSLGRQIPDVTLNVDSLAAALNELWPASHRVANEPYAHLLSDLAKHGISTTAQLRSLINKWREAVLIRAAREAERLRTAVSTYGVKNGTVTIQKEGRITAMNVTPEIVERANAGMFYTHTGLTWTALHYSTGERRPDEPIEP